MGLSGECGRSGENTFQSMKTRMVGSIYEGRGDEVTSWLGGSRSMENLALEEKKRVTPRG